MGIDHKETELHPDVVSMQKIPILTTILDVVCRTTGMGFAAVARVTDERWITCSVNDKINFGLKPGDELKLETTNCNEVRQRNTLVVIDNVDKDHFYCKHPTPVIYGFKSFISVPIVKKDGSFFGTLCAIDPHPASLDNPEVKGMFTLFSDLISFHLSAIDQIELSESILVKEREERTKALEHKNEELIKSNAELEAFAYVASHDLQEPLRKIETFSNLILQRDYDKLSDGGKNYFDRLINSIKRMQTLINDLMMYTKLQVHDQIFKDIPLRDVVEDIKANYNQDYDNKKVVFEVSEMCNAFVIPFQFNQLLQNLISNSAKFSKPGVDPLIKISGVIVRGDQLLNHKLSPGTSYCHITVSDNGIGFEPQYSERIFKVFQRLNGRSEYDGTGIGLAIVKKIVDNHNGFIIATSQVNKGAKFDIYLPQPSLAET